jgi:hypothetical protein
MMRLCESASAFSQGEYRFRLVLNSSRRGSGRQAEAVQDLPDSFGGMDGAENPHASAATVTNQISPMRTAQARP